MSFFDFPKSGIWTPLRTHFGSFFDPFFDPFFDTFWVHIRLFSLILLTSRYPKKGSKKGSKTDPFWTSALAGGRFLTPLRCLPPLNPFLDPLLRPPGAIQAWIWKKWSGRGSFLDPKNAILSEGHWRCPAGSVRDFGIFPFWNPRTPIFGDFFKWDSGSSTLTRGGVRARVLCLYIKPSTEVTLILYPLFWLFFGCFQANLPHRSEK